MLKRYQVLLNEWQVDHYKIIAKKYDVSMSEMIRMALCLDIIYATNMVFPKFSAKIDDKILKKTIKTRKVNETMSSEEFHKFLSQIYFEARKATELWSKEQNQAQ